MSQKPQIDYLQLIKEANTIFQKSYPGSILFSAIGSPQAGVAKRADDLTVWIFRSQTQNQGTAEIKYANGTFSTPTLIGFWTGLEFKPLPQGTIRLDAAIVILNNNGFTQGFSNVGLGTAVVPQAQPMFWFCVNQQTQGVSASTGQFFGNLFPCKAGSTVGSLAE